MDPSKVKEIFKRFKAYNPHPTTELKYHSAFELLVAVILSARATDKSVNKATEGLFKVAKTPKQFLELGLTKLKTYVKTIGLYNTKAANIIKTCQILIDDYHGRVPETREALEDLPGVGRKTANVILNTAFKKPVIPVDTHIFRVSNRTRLATGKTPLAVEEKLMQVVPARYRKDAHHWLLLHGRYICRAPTPRCGHCYIRDLCEYDEKNNL